MKHAYELAKLSLDVDGIYWVNYIGNIPEQGGNRFGPGQVSFKRIDDALLFLEATIKENLATYKDMIANKLN